jgi:hypothetical protein
MLCAIGIPLLVPFLLERRRKRHGIGKLPYTWGYFVGCWLVFLGALTAAVGLLGYAGKPGVGPSALVLSAVFYVPGWFVIRRHRWAWIVGSIVSLNPVWWLINHVYGRNRWDEFVRLGRSTESPPSSR